MLVYIRRALQVKEGASRFALRFVHVLGILLYAVKTHPHIKCVRYMRCDTAAADFYCRHIAYNIYRMCYAR